MSCAPAVGGGGAHPGHQRGDDRDRDDAVRHHHQQEDVVVDQRAGRPLVAGPVEQVEQHESAELADRHVAEHPAAELGQLGAAPARGSRSATASGSRPCAAPAAGRRPGPRCRAACRRRAAGLAGGHSLGSTHRGAAVEHDEQHRRSPITTRLLRIGVHIGAAKCPRVFSTARDQRRPGRRRRSSAASGSDSVVTRCWSLVGVPLA